MSDVESDNEVEAEQVEENQEETENEKQVKTNEEHVNFNPVKKKYSPYEFQGKDNPEIILTKDDAMESLKRPGFSPDGLGIAYTELDLRSKDLINIEVATSFKNVMYLNVSGNKLTNRSLLCLRLMQQLLMIRADSNRLTSTELPRMALVQILTLNNNNLTKISIIDHPNLGILLLNNNQIQQVENLDPNVLKNLRRLSIKSNSLTSLQGITDLISLRYLYLQHNKIENLDGIDKLNNLIVLSLAGNQITKLNGFSSNMKLLRELSLQNNRIASIKEISKLDQLPSLKRLTVNKNPYNKSGENRQEILSRVIRLEELNARKVNSSEKKTALELRSERNDEDDDEDGEETDEIAEDDDDLNEKNMNVMKFN